MPTPAVIPTEKILQGALRLIARMIRDKDHGQIVITIRDGHIQRVTKTQQYLPANLPES